MARPPSALTVFIRSLPKDLPVAEVIARAKAEGHETSESNVSRVRGMMAGSKATSKKVAKKAAVKNAAENATPATAPAGETAVKPVSGSDFVRNQPLDASPAVVVAMAKTQGITISDSLVRKVRGAQGRTVKASAPKKTPASKRAPAVAKAPSSKLSKSEFIRQQPLTLSAAEIVAAGKEAGLNFAANLVYTVQSRASAKKPAAKTPGKKVAKKGVAPKETAAPATAKSAGVSKSAFIRMHPSLSTAEVIAAAKAQGLSFTSSLVYAVRGAKAVQATPKKAASKKTAAKKTAATKPAPASKAAAPSKSAFIRNLPLTLSAKEVVSQGKAAGIKFDQPYVYKIRRAVEKKGAGRKPVVNKMASPKKVVATSKETPAPKPTGSNGTRPSGSASSVEELLRAVAAELGLGRAMEILEGERARVRKVMGG